MTTKCNRPYFSQVLLEHVLSKTVLEHSVMIQLVSEVAVMGFRQSSCELVVERHQSILLSQGHWISIDLTGVDCSSSFTFPKLGSILSTYYHIICR